MAISHTCMNCCAELGAIRARPEPHYGLRIVTCPSCGTVAVRAPNNNIQFWRTVRRTRAALIRLQLGLLALGAAVASVFFASHSIAQNSDPDSWFYEPLPIVVIQVAIVAVFYMIIGMLARLALGFRRAWVTPVSVLLISTALLIASVLGNLPNLLSIYERVSPPWGDRFLMPQELGIAMLSAVVFTIPVTLGLIPGQFLIWAARKSERSRVTRIRKARRRRLGAGY